MAGTYMAEHPNVNIEITVMENEAFKAAIQTNISPATCPTCSSPGAAVRCRTR
ncbi:MAG: hypothetical protein R2705_21590 [Ilumatobacteraceae bacterium]